MRYYRGIKIAYRSIRKCHSLLDKPGESIAQSLLKKRVKNKSFTIISSNCWGAFIYQQLEMEYKTPFVGLFLYAPCYIRLLEDLQEYLFSPINFINTSRYDSADKTRNTGHNYPIGLLNGDVEIHFKHYKNPLEAEQKWNRRVKKINWNNIFVSFSDRDYCNEKLLKKFDQLNYPYKVCFTATKYSDLKSAVWVEECKDEPYINTEITLSLNSSLYKKHFDVASWLNKGTGKKS